MNMVIFDKNDIDKNKNMIRGHVVGKDKESGKILFENDNKVIVSGSEFNALKDFNFDSTWSSEKTFLDSIPSYDTALSNAGRAMDIADSKEWVSTTGILSMFAGTVKPGDIEAYDKIYRYFTRRVYLFCVGIDGCGIENSRVFRVDNTKWIAPYQYSKYDPGTGIIDTNISNCLIPFKVRSVNYDLTVGDRNKYFGRSVYNGEASYYFKSFDSEPVLIRKYADDSTDLEQVDDVWANQRKSDAEVVVKLQLSIDNTDCREYFNNTTGINTAKINTISLCTAVPYKSKIGDVYYTYYEDIRPFTKFNFPNESLINASKGINISYYLYY